MATYEPILEDLSSWFSSHKDDFPFITLTYAQSLDGSIAAGKGGAPLLLSSSASMTMTHRLRAMHDGICIGIGTVLSDNPSLTTRLCEGSSPRPIIFDSNLRCPTTAKFLPNRRAIFVCKSYDDDEAHKSRRRSLEALGAVVMEFKDLRNFSEIFGRIHNEHRDLKTIMIEGGAAMIRSLLTSPSGLINALLVTIAPLMVGGLVPTQPWNEGQAYLQVTDLEDSTEVVDN